MEKDTPEKIAAVETSPKTEAIESQIEETKPELSQLEQELSELIFSHLASKGVLSLSNVDGDNFNGTKLGDKLPHGISTKEGVRWEEFGPEHFDFTEGAKLSKPTVTKLRVMRGFESTINLKVSIFTTIKPPIMGVKDKTNNISDLQQVTKRAYFTFRLHGTPTYHDKPL